MPVPGPPDWRAGSLTWIYAIPRYLLLAFVCTAFSVLSAAVFFAILLTGRYRGRTSISSGGEQVVAVRNGLCRDDDRPVSVPVRPRPPGPRRHAQRRHPRMRPQVDVDRRSEMPRIKGEILIGRPVDVVFDYVADQRNEPQYNPEMVRAEKITPGRSGREPGSARPWRPGGARPTCSSSAPAVTGRRCCPRPRRCRRPISPTR